MKPNPYRISFLCFHFVFLSFVISGIQCDKESNSGPLNRTSSLADRLWTDLKLHRFYDTASSLKFCFRFGSSMEVLHLLRATLPADALASNYTISQDDGICQDWDSLLSYICKTEEDYLLYIKVQYLVWISVDFCLVCSSI